MNADKFHLFAMPEGHARKFGIDIRNGPIEAQGGIPILGPFTYAIVAKQWAELLATGRVGDILPANYDLGRLSCPTCGSGDALALAEDKILCIACYHVDEVRMFDPGYDDAFGEPWHELAPWPKNHAARLLDDYESITGVKYLHAGTILTPVKRWHGGIVGHTFAHERHVFKLRFDQVIPVPNFLPADPDDMAAELSDEQMLVGDLLNAGYTLYRLPAKGKLKEAWEMHLKAELGPDPVVIFWHKANENPDVDLPPYMTDENPTTVTVAQMVVWHSWPVGGGI